RRRRLVDDVLQRPGHQPAVERRRAGHQRHPLRSGLTRVRPHPVLRTERAPHSARRRAPHRGSADPRILVVDDGSGERFAAVFDRAVLAGATVVHHAHNRGKGAALRTGFSWIRDHARGDVIVTADADGQHTVRDILAVANSTDPDGASLVLGCRAFDGDVPLRSRAGNAFARRLFRLAAGWSLGDTQTGLRGVPPAMIDWLLGVPGDRFEYEQRVLLGLTRAGFDAVEVEIETVYLEQN